MLPPAAGSDLVTNWELGINYYYPGSHQFRGHKTQVRGVLKEKFVDAWQGERQKLFWEQNLHHRRSKRPLSEETHTWMRMEFKKIPVFLDN